MKSSDLDVLIVGAGAAGMMCAIEAGKRGRRVRVIDHARAQVERHGLARSSRRLADELTPGALLRSLVETFVGRQTRRQAHRLLEPVERIDLVVDDAPDLQAKTV